MNRNMTEDNKCCRKCATFADAAQKKPICGYPASCPCHQPNKGIEKYVKEFDSKLPGELLYKNHGKTVPAKTAILNHFRATLQKQRTEVRNEVLEEVLDILSDPNRIGELTKAPTMNVPQICDAIRGLVTKLKDEI